eukprot:COSAG04_NODE_26874_length_289_cov_1.089474_1_plen_64_part_01
MRRFIYSRSATHHPSGHQNDARVPARETLHGERPGLEPLSESLDDMTTSSFLKAEGTAMSALTV